MAHFTYASGVYTATVSLRCPTCLTQVEPPLSGKTPHLDELCCSPKCKKVYYQKAYALEKVAWETMQGRKRLPSRVAQRLKTTCSLSNLAEKYLSTKADERR